MGYIPVRAPKQPSTNQHIRGKQRDLSPYMFGADNEIQGRNRAAGARPARNFAPIKAGNTERSLNDPTLRVVSPTPRHKRRLY